jgi:ABC-type glutathione transport system ATPase component
MTLAVFLDIPHHSAPPVHTTPEGALTDARADRIIVLYNGEVQTEGTHNQLVKKNELYRRLTEMQLVKV